MFKHLKTNTKIAKNAVIKKPVIFVIAAYFALIGGLMFINSKAAMGDNILEPENGTITSPATAVSDASASSGKYVLFKQASTSPSGQAIPSGQVTSGGHSWTPIFSEDFLVDAPMGSWANSCSYSQIMYTGATGTKWRSYPQCYQDTFQKRYYRPDQVLSVHDGVLDYYLHTVDGHPAGANPSPLITGTSEYQTYGRYTARIRQTTNSISDYYMAWLLWPENDSDYQCAESDFPEGGMGGSSYSYFSHYGCSGSQDYGQTNNIDKTKWHTYTQEWLPGRRNYYVDGVLVGSATNQIWSQPQRWQMQTETNTNCENRTNGCTQSGNLNVDWVVVYKY